MLRTSLCFAVAVSFAEFSLSAAEPDAVTVIAADYRCAALLPVQHHGPRIEVLVQAESQSEGDIDARALSLVKTAAFFLYLSDHESPLTAMYRERLQAHGVKPVDLRVHVPLRARAAELKLADRNNNPSLDPYLGLAYPKP